MHVANKVGVAIVWLKTGVLFDGFPAQMPEVFPGDHGLRCPVARQAHNLKVAGSNPAPRLNHPARICSDPPLSGPAENLGSPAPLYVFCLVTSFRCRLYVLSQYRLSLSWFTSVVHGQQKTLLTSRQAGLENPMDPMIASPAYQKPIGVIPSLMFAQTT
jgi:hypothetical protein